MERFRLFLFGTFVETPILLAKISNNVWNVIDFHKLITSMKARFSQAALP